MRKYFALQTGSSTLTQIIECGEKLALVAEHVEVLTRTETGAIIGEVGGLFRYTCQYICLESELGASGDPCSDLYYGTDPFSEVENQHARDYIADNIAGLQAYLSIHSYSQFVLLPWGYDDIKPDDYAELVNTSSLITSDRNTISPV